jgi:hypothetical protein
LLGPQATDRVQLRTLPQQWPVEQGFSGPRVWDLEAGGVVGMIVTSPRRHDTTARLIPSAALGEV